MERSVCRTSQAAGFLAQLPIIGRCGKRIGWLWSGTRTRVGDPVLIPSALPEGIVGEQLPAFMYRLQAAGIASCVQGRQQGGPRPRIGAP